MPVYICNLLLANGSTSNNYSIFIKKCSCFQKRKRTQIREDTGINNVKDTDTEIIFVTVHTGADAGVDDEGECQNHETYRANLCE